MPETSLMIKDKFLFKLTLVLLIFFFSVPSNAASRALVIGLGEQEDKRWAKINGDNDIAYVVKLLQQRGFTDIRTLKNNQATKSGILKAFYSLKESCSLGDRVYIHYSGHGQLMTDLNGDESLKWNGWHAQWDQSLIPYDAYMTYCNKDRGEKHISDDELAKLLLGIRKKVGKKGEIIVVIDACHSGDATCGPLDEPIRGVDTKFVIPKDPKAPVEYPIKEEWLTISSCQPYELCSEIKDKKVGKLTYALFNLGASFFRLDNKKMEKLLDETVNKYGGRLRQSPMVRGKR